MTRSSDLIRTKFAVLTAIAMLSLVLPVRVAIADAPGTADPMTVVKTGIDQVLAVFNDKQLPLNKRREKLRRMSLEYFDFDNMAKSVLGYHWRELTPQQRSEFVPLFTEFIQDAYLSKLEQTTVQKVQEEARTARVEFTKQSYFGPDYAEVFSQVSLKDQNNPLQVNYLMHQIGGQWRVYDVNVQAISLIANYRNQFNRIINNQGYQTLVSDLQAKRQQLRNYMDQEAENSK